MTRQILFQIHWFLGITAGVVLAVIGVSGAAFSFNEELMRWLSPGIATMTAQNRPRLSPDELVARGERQRPGKRVMLLEVESDPQSNPKATFEFDEGDASFGISYLDPYTGRLLGTPVGMQQFISISALHQWLLVPGHENGPGRFITGATGIALIYFATSGIYLRWPRRMLDLRSWFVLDWRMTGRNFYRALHAVTGAWVALIYLLSALTGLYFAYDWYKNAVQYTLTGHASGEELVSVYGTLAVGVHVPDRPGRVSLDVALNRFRHETGGQPYDKITFTKPLEGSEVGIFAKAHGARHLTQGDYMSVDGTSGRVLRPLSTYAQRPMSEKILIGMYDVHRGSYFGTVGRIAICLVSLGMPLFTVTGFLLYIARRKKKAELRADAVESGTRSVVEIDAAHSILVAYATQTGSAERLAWRTAAALPAARLVRLGQLKPAELAATRQALFIVSTYGDGEPPDEARRFASREMETAQGLGELSFSVLALGDRQYPDFCAFGHRIDRWLSERGARRLYDLVECDTGTDVNALRLWQTRLAELGGRSDPDAWGAGGFQPWRLVERQHLNPNSAGEGAFHIALEPAASKPDRWMPGDICQILPRQHPRRIDAFLKTRGLDSDDVLLSKLAVSVLPAPEVTAGVDRGSILAGLHPLQPRDYSIASLHESNRIELLVRQTRTLDGSYGMGSGWLTDGAQLGDHIDVRIRPNSAFRSPSDAAAPLILIGNGTGLAGLIAHLRQRAATAGAAPVWLLFGERSAAHDAFYEDELRDYLDRGVLARLDRAWSRDANCGRYVQHLLSEAGPELGRWVEGNAMIMVCGSLKGMAASVDAALRQELGNETVDALIGEGRYRRDVY
jgi:sulfite reductase (NADPH) flavoprotein alpha-component